jgi:hypothetical protein
LNTAQLRVVASAAEPVSLMIDGYMVQATANVDLAAEDVPSGTENTYYAFANRADGSTTFTLSVSTSSTEGENQRRIGRLYWDGTKIEKDSVRTELAVSIKSLLSYVEPQICEDVDAFNRRQCIACGYHGIFDCLLHPAYRQPHCPIRSQLWLALVYVQ